MKRFNVILFVYLAILLSACGSTGPSSVESSNESESLSPLSSVIRQQLTASDASQNASLGYSVGVSGNTAIVGARGSGALSNPASGKAYIFKKTQSGWVEAQAIVPTDGALFQNFGTRVAIDGNDAIVSGIRFVYFLQKQPDGTWVVTQKLSGDVTEYPYGEFGLDALDISDGVAVVSAIREEKVYVFRKGPTGTWYKDEVLIASDYDDYYGIRFGQSVAIEGGVIAVGANAIRLDREPCHQDGGWNTCIGGVYIFEETNGAYLETAFLQPGDALQDELRVFGSRVAISGNTLAVSAPNEPVGGQPGRGTAYVFEKIDGAWIEKQKLILNGAPQQFGFSLDIDGSTLAVGALAAKTVGVFRKVGGIWEPYYVYSSGDESLGYSASLSDDTLFVGVPYYANTGAAFVFTLPSTNQSPTVTLSGPYSADQGDAVTFDGSASSDPDGDPLTFDWDFGDGSTAPDAGATPSHSYTDAGTFTVSLTVTDPSGASSTASADVVIASNLPGRTAVTAPAFVGDLLLEVVNNNGFSVGDRIVINPGGPNRERNAITGFSSLVLETPLQFDHALGETVAVNGLPVIEAITPSVELVPVNTNVSVSADFSDPGLVDTHSATFDWGDGSISAGTVKEVEGTGTVVGEYVYTEPGVYTVGLTVTETTDDGVGEGQHQYIVVYDPSGGFVTGGGWIDSPAGAYKPDAALTGKANFGFVSKYKKGANVPTGQTQFQFRVADLDFQSESYDWLVIAGAKAQFKGTGDINGTGDYGFMLSAVDGNLKGGDAPDTFRIKIWDRTTDEIVYDNQIGHTDDAEPSTVIGGGSIVVHKGKGK